MLRPKWKGAGPRQTSPVVGTFTSSGGRGCTHNRLDVYTEQLSHLKLAAIL
jgi:hypothetical protein